MSLSKSNEAGLLIPSDVCIPSRLCITYNNDICLVLNKNLIFRILEPCLDTLRIFAFVFLFYWSWCQYLFSDRPFGLCPSALFSQLWASDGHTHWCGYRSRQSFLHQGSGTIHGDLSCLFCSQILPLFIWTHSLWGFLFVCLFLPVAGDQGAHHAEHQASLPGWWLCSKRNAEDHLSALQRYEDQAADPGGPDWGGQHEVQVRPKLTGKRRLTLCAVIPLCWSTLYKPLF